MASVCSLNVRQLSEMFDLVISLLEAFRESPDNQPRRLHNNARFFFYRFGGICSRSSSFDSAAWVSSTCWISATSESGNPSGIQGCLCLPAGWRIYVGISAGHCFIPQPFSAVNFISYMHCFVFNT